MVGDKNALLLIDIQNIYFREGYFQLPFADRAVEHAEKVLTWWRKEHGTIIHIRHNFGDSAKTPSDQEFHQKVAPLNGELVIEKQYPSSFLGTNLLEELQKRDIRELTVVGMMTNMCVDTTVRACQDHGIRVTLVQDACAAHEIVFGEEKIDAETVHKVFIGAMSGMFAQVVDTDSIVTGVFDN